MNQVVDNPYVAPEAELEVQHAAGDLSAFTRFSTWAVLGLSIITMGIYSIYWLYSRTQQLNKVSSDRISQGFVSAAVVLYVANMALSLVVSFITDGAGVLAVVSSVLSLVSSIMFIVWAFKFRNRLNRVTQSAGKPTWCGPILTFFLNVLYLNYKINQNIDQRN